MGGATGRALSSLTVRGRSLLAGGATLLVFGALAGERPFVHLGVFVLALPLVSVVAIARARLRVSARRAVDPVRLPRGGAADVRLQVTNAGSRPGGLWALTEELPPELGTSPRFVVERLAAGGTTTAGYRVHGSRRGRHVLGPLRLRVHDPFGLVERSAVGTDTATLLVVPRVRPLDPGGPAGGHGDGGEGARRAIAVHGEDDVSSREYRHGDDLRKVHWRATARTGELMVRLEERPWRAQATLFLDTRARAHLIAGGGPGTRSVSAPGPEDDECPPADSLEWLVEAAASIGTALSRRGAALRLVTDTGELLAPDGARRVSADGLLERLATTTPSRVPSLAHGIDQLCRAAADGPVVCLLGAVGPDEVVDLIRARSGPGPDLAVLSAIESWAAPGSDRGRRPSAAAHGTPARHREETAALLRSAGWHVAVASADRTVAQVWAALGGRGAAPSGTEAVGAGA